MKEVTTIMNVKDGTTIKVRILDDRIWADSLSKEELETAFAALGLGKHHNPNPVIHGTELDYSNCHSIMSQQRPSEVRFPLNFIEFSKS